MTSSTAPPTSHARRQAATAFTTAEQVARTEVRMAFRSWTVRVLAMTGIGLVFAVTLYFLARSAPTTTRVATLSWMSVATVCVIVMAAFLHGVVIARRCRVDGSLQILQAAPTSGAGIMLGQTLAAAAVACVFPAAALPFMVIYVILGRPPSTVLLTLLVMLFTALVTAAMGVGLGHLPRRPRFGLVTALVTSLMLLGAGPALYRLLLPSQTAMERDNVHWQARPGEACTYRLILRPTTHSERVWWLNAGSPLVLLADVAGDAPDQPGERTEANPLDRIQRNVRVARSGPPAVIDECSDDRDDTPAPRQDASWPYSLLMLGGMAGLTFAGGTWRLESSGD